MENDCTPKQNDVSYEAEVERKIQYIYKICGLALGAGNQWMHQLMVHCSHCIEVLSFLQSEHATSHLNILVGQVEVLFQKTFVFLSEFMTKFPEKKQSLSQPKKERLFLEILALSINKCIANACIDGGVKDRYVELDVANVTGFKSKQKVAEHFNMLAAVRDTGICERVFIQEMFKLVCDAEPAGSLLYASPAISVKRYGYPMTEHSRDKKAFIHSIVNASIGLQDQGAKSPDIMQAAINKVFTSSDGTDRLLSAGLEEHNFSHEVPNHIEQFDESQHANRMDFPAPSEALRTRNLASNSGPPTGASEHDDVLEILPEDSSIVLGGSMDNSHNINDESRQSPQTDMLDQLLADMTNTLKGTFQLASMPIIPAMADAAVTESEPKPAATMNHHCLMERSDQITSTLDRQHDAKTLEHLASIFQGLIQIADFVVQSDVAFPKADIQYDNAQFQFPQADALAIAEHLKLLLMMLSEMIELSDTAQQKFSGLMRDTTGAGDSPRKITHILLDGLMASGVLSDFLYGVRCIFADFNENLQCFLSGTDGDQRSVYASAQMDVIEESARIDKQIHAICKVMEPFVLEDTESTHQMFTELGKKLFDIFQHDY